MKLEELLKDIKVMKVAGDPAKEIGGISYDSRKTKKGDLFICRGVVGDGHDYAGEAYDKGARAFLVGKELDRYNDDAVYVYTDDTMGALSLVSRTFFGYPDEKLFTIGITGTKGKTTTTYFIRAVLQALNINCGIIGTIYNYIGRKRYESATTTPTTPEGYEIQKMMKMMVDEDTKVAAMEVSSHALALGRVKGMSFDIGIFTNLGRDHLDFHSDMNDYFQAKAKLFEQSQECILNIDDEKGAEAFGIIKANGKKAYSVSLKEREADFYGYDIIYAPGYTSFKLGGSDATEFRIGMHGKHNVYNALNAVAAASLYGIDPEDIKDSLIGVNVPGRQERFENPLGHIVIIDYAHTPNSLKEILETYRAVKSGKLIVVFGAGGDRDRTKRPLMGMVAGELADFSIITTDNPRTEKPEDIISEIEEGIKRVDGARYMTICNRVEAIEYAIQTAKKDDIIILAGKGHETYQEINHVKHHLDEREILQRIYGKL